VLGAGLSPDYNIILEKIKADPRYKLALGWGASRPGHPEGTIGAHIQELERNLDSCLHVVPGACIQKLKVLIHTHDTFKGEALTGVPISNPKSHASLASAFLAEFTRDPDLLAMVQYHDEPYAIWKRIESGKPIDEHRLQRLFDVIKDINLFATFVAIDGVTEGKDARPVQWFLTKLVERGLCHAQILNVPEIIVQGSSGLDADLSCLNDMTLNRSELPEVGPDKFAWSIRQLVEEMEEVTPVPAISLGEFLARLGERIRQSDFEPGNAENESWGTVLNTVQLSANESATISRHHSSPIDLDVRGAKKLLDLADTISTKDDLVSFIEMLSFQAEHPFSSWANPGLYSFLDGVANSVGRVLLSSGGGRVLSPRIFAQLLAQAAFFE
jgi:hypothetical protein